jgi:hypothetical protein
MNIPEHADLSVGDCVTFWVQVAWNSVPISMVDANYIGVIVDIKNSRLVDEQGVLMHEWSECAVLFGDQTVWCSSGQLKKL